MIDILSCSDKKGRRGEEEEIDADDVTITDITDLEAKQARVWSVVSFHISMDSSMKLLEVLMGDERWMDER